MQRRVIVDLLNVLFAFAVALTYPVQFFAAVEVLEGRAGLSDKPGAVHRTCSNRRLKQARESHILKIEMAQHLDSIRPRL